MSAASLGMILLAMTATPAAAQSNAIPTDGLELWVKADGPMTIANGHITEWTDLSPKKNNAIHDGFGASIPVVATVNGKPTMRFSGAYTGFHFSKISTIRSVFAVLSKVSSSCLPTLPNYGTPAKFWIGGTDTTNFHPEHGCAIYNANLGEVSPNLVNGKTYLNGTLVDGRKARFPFELGVISMVSLANVAADTIARDRTMQDRSWQGDISEILIYSKPLDDVTRVAVQNILAQKYAIGGAGDGGVADASAGGRTGDGSAGGAAGSALHGGGGATGGATSSSGGSTTSSSGGTSNGPGGAAAGGLEPADAANPAGSKGQGTANGCGCRTVRASTGNSAGILFLAGVVVGLRRRRRDKERRDRPFFHH